MTQADTNKAQTSPFRKKFRKFLFIFSLSLIVIWLIIYFISGMTYSEGTRSGILTKISRKGFVFKTYEGEMNVGGFSQGDGTIMPATIFKFSVRDKDVYKELEEVQGKKVVLHYRQVMHNFFWQGESDYFVYDVGQVKQVSSPGE
jgi:hypothetical protein